MIDTLMFVVLGRPAPQGSKKVVPTAAGPRVVESSKAVGPYRETVAREARVALEGIPPELRAALLDGPVSVSINFFFSRPAGHLRSGRFYPEVRASAPARPGVAPDVDKTARSVLDALEMARVVGNDARVVTLCASKRYAAHGDPERTVVEVSPLAGSVGAGMARALAA